MTKSPLHGYYIAPVGNEARGIEVPKIMQSEPDAVLTSSQWATMLNTSEQVSGLSRDSLKAAFKEALEETLQDADLNLHGTDYLSNTVAARINLARSRWV